MNLPNKLTLFRVILIPFYVLFQLGVCGGVYCDFIALAFFLVASFTDFLDGYIARKYNLITDFGKFMDPLADKLLVCSALVCLLSIDRTTVVPVLLILSREFIISGFRLIAADKGRVLAASFWGKIKTVSQMIMVVLMILNISALNKITLIITWISVALTVISLVDYIIKNRDVMGE